MKKRINLSLVFGLICLVLSVVFLVLAVVGLAS